MSTTILFNALFKGEKTRHQLEARLKGPFHGAVRAARRAGLPIRFTGSHYILSLAAAPSIVRAKGGYRYLRPSGSWSKPMPLGDARRGLHRVWRWQ